eukprot:2246471-Pleurochrysis_carterae.AAC.1
MSYLGIRFVRVLGHTPAKSTKLTGADGFDCLYRRALRFNEISGTIPDIATLTKLVFLCAAIPSNMACTCVA